MNPLFVAAAAVQELCRNRDWGFCFIGGLASDLEQWQFGGAQ
jgi:hypothetical protein